MILLHGYDDTDKGRGEMVVLYSGGDVGEARDEYGGDFDNLDIHDTNGLSEWPTTLPTDRGLIPE